MEKYSEVVGLPVICAENGKNIGIVRDIVFCPENKSVRALLLERSGYEIGRKTVLVEDILSIGKDAVIVSDSRCLTTVKKAEEAGAFKGRGNVVGLRIYSKSGQDYGVVKDVLFDFRSGEIEGVEISDGLLQDIIKGRNIIPLFGKVEFGPENILVDREAVEEMMSTGGGIKRKLLGGE